MRAARLSSVLPWASQAPGSVPWPGFQRPKLSRTAYDSLPVWKSQDDSKTRDTGAASPGSPTLDSTGALSHLSGLTSPNTQLLQEPGTTKGTGHAGLTLPGFLSPVSWTQIYVPTPPAQPPGKKPCRTMSVSPKFSLMSVSHNANAKGIISTSQGLVERVR